MQRERRGETKLGRRGRGEESLTGPGMGDREEELEEEEQRPATGLVRVKRDVIAACMTCPICHKLFSDATTISECLHTFCRKCIYEKLTDEEGDCCPICKIDLGCSPIEKLRPDHSIQDMRAKLFPAKRRKVDVPEVSPSVAFPARRKERSLTSLAASGPRVLTASTGRRSKQTIKRKEDNDEEKLNAIEGISQNSRQGSLNAEPSNVGPIKDEETAGKSEMWKPLNCLIEAASRSKSVKVNGQTSGQSIDFPKVEVKEIENPAPVKARRRRRSSKALAEASCVKQMVMSPIWFSLTAATDQEEHARLPQISASYVRVKDCNLPVLFIQKYLAKKLDLASESEVEIKCRGQSVSPGLAMWELAGLWLQRTPTSVTASAEDFVMALSYARRPIPA